MSPFKLKREEIRRNAYKSIRKKDRNSFFKSKIEEIKKILHELEKKKRMTMIMIMATMAIIL